MVVGIGRKPSLDIDVVTVASRTVYIERDGRRLGILPHGDSNCDGAEAQFHLGAPRARSCGGGCMYAKCAEVKRGEAAEA